jgi:flavin reductase (DIM6/NTAB) family NADH-FMN oxidoreductase RutF
MIIDPKEIATKDLHQFILGSIAPRPIAFVSTIDENGVPNLAPYSFFNAFSSNPPILVFSSNRRVGNNTTKDTLHNIEMTRECVIHVVTHEIVRQMTLTSIDYSAETDEFVKGGFTPLPSDLVRPFRVKESPVHYECKVSEIIPLGTHGGAGHLIICEVLRMHIDDRIIDENGRIDPDKIDLMGRMGRAYYVRASGDAIETYFQPFDSKAIGFDALPEQIRKSKWLSGNEIAEIASITEIPEFDIAKSESLSIFSEEQLHTQIKELIALSKKEEAAELVFNYYPQE